MRAALTRCFHHCVYLDIVSRAASPDRLHLMDIDTTQLSRSFYIKVLSSVRRNMVTEIPSLPRKPPGRTYGPGSKVASQGIYKNNQMNVLLCYFAPPPRPGVSGRWSSYVTNTMAVFTVPLKIKNVILIAYVTCRKKFYLLNMVAKLYMHNWNYE